MCLHVGVKYGNLMYLEMLVTNAFLEMTSTLTSSVMFPLFARTWHIPFVSH